MRGRDQQTSKKPRGRSSKASAVPATPDAAAPRGTPAIKTALRRGVRQRRSSVNAAAAAAAVAQQQEEILPSELLQLVGGRLSTEDLKAASLVCRQWSRALRGAVTSFGVHLRTDAESNAAKARALNAALPQLSSLHINFGARSDAASLAPFFSTLNACERLRDVRITSWVPSAPQKGAAPLGCFAALKLGEVTGLTFDGAALSTSDMLSIANGAATATALQSLTLAPGAWPHFSQLGPFQMPAWLLPAVGADFAGQPRMSSIATVALLTCKLPGLQRLAIGVDGSGQAEFCQSLRHMTALTSLDLLGGAPVSSKALAMLSALPALRELRVQPAVGTGGSEPSSLEEHGLLALTQLRHLGVRLRGRPAEGLCRDLLALTRRRAAPALVELELSRCVWSAEVGACIAGLTSLTRLKLEALECVRPARASASASRAAMSVDLQPLMALRGGMRAFELSASTGSIAGVVRGLGRLWAAWAPTLEDVRLSDLSVAELDPWDTLPALGRCGSLTSLRLLLREPMAHQVGAVDVGGLPATLKRLALRNVTVTGDPAALRGRMASLEALSLRQCDVVESSALPPNRQLTMLLGTAMRCGTMRRGPMRGVVPLAEALPGLRSLELVALPGLRDDDFAGLGRLTALTTLLVCASGTVEVTHAALQALTGLTRLRQLRWHVGDVTDLLPDVASLRCLESLVALHLPSYLHGQFARWSAYNALPPLCDVHVEMPLP